ncbi:hypothetical protein BXZ70DRAFT_911767 [Cristinia sonorae]|uniref:Uncharacterized protein n=1 Tax=Cristinia sonorae TaxID=1940300 RepID=A0A8K0UY15_9AGAR|nr:hypothetical protein BXZ70DRAFT_911767 [Cristinia sonorae]
MKSKLLKSLRFRVKQLLGFKMSSSEPPVFSEPPPDSIGTLLLSVPVVGLHDIQNYAQTLLRNLLERDELGEDTFMIHSIYHFRSTRKVEHEFIVVRYTVNDADGDMGLQLLCIEWDLALLEDLFSGILQVPLAEKPAYEPEVEATFKRLASLVESAKNTSSTLLSSGGTSASLSYPTVLAWPVVDRILELPTVDVKCLCMVELGSNRPLSLLRLVWIVAHLRGFQPVYSVLFHQCYWLAASVIEIACEMTGQVPKYFGDSDGWEAMGETVFASAVTDPQGKAFQWSSTPGMVMSLPIMSLKDAMVKNMYDMVVRKWESDVIPQIAYAAEKRLQERHNMGETAGKLPEERDLQLAAIEKQSEDIRREKADSARKPMQEREELMRQEIQEREELDGKKAMQELEDFEGQIKEIQEQLRLVTMNASSAE